MLRNDTQFEAIAKEKEIFVNTNVVDFDIIPLTQTRMRKKKKCQERHHQMNCKT